MGETRVIEVGTRVAFLRAMNTTQNLLLLSALAASLQTFGCDKKLEGSIANEIGAKAKPQPQPTSPEPKPKPTPGPKDTGDPAP